MPVFVQFCDAAWSRCVFGIWLVCFHGGGGGIERENSNSKSLFDKGCSLGSVKNLTISPC